MPGLTLWRRADERHVAEEHVQELRQLVDVPAPQQAAGQRHAIVASGRLADLVVVMNPHGAEFVDPERLLVEAVALLAEVRGAGAVEADQGRDQEKERQQQHEAERRADDVEQALRDDLEECERRARKTERRHVRDLDDLHLGEAVEDALGAEMDRDRQGHKPVDDALDRSVSDQGRITNTSSGWSARPMSAARSRSGSRLPFDCSTAWPTISKPRFQGW